MRRRIRGVAAALLATMLFGARTFADTGDAGQVGSTARLGQGARALAMGQAYSAVSDDASSLFYNTGALAQVRSPEVGFAWRVMPDLDRRQGYANAVLPLREQASIGVSWVYSGVGDIVERNTQGVAGETFSFSENFFTLAFAKQFGRVIMLGGGVHYVQQSLFDVSAGSVGLSVGMHARFDRESRRPYSDALQRLTVGAAVGHAGISLRFDSGEYYEPRGQGTGTVSNETFPVVVRLGSAYRFLARRNLLLALEGTWVEHQHARFYAGTEWGLSEHLLLRAGLADLCPSAGFGLRQPWGGRMISLDYAFVSNPTGVSSDHVISLGVAF